MAVAYLPWDTDFFGTRIARVVLDEVPLREAIESGRREGVECLYLVVSASAVGTITEATRAGAVLVDVRMELDGVIDSTGDPRARTATSADLPSLERMAEQLAASSRFIADKRFDPNAIAEMYRIWIRQCLDDGVVVVPQEGITGLVGARAHGEEAHIELVYVAPQARGGGLAYRLVVAATQQLGATSARVATQAGNVGAQRVYQSLGLRTRSVEAVLHLWLREAAAPREAQSH